LYFSGKDHGLEFFAYIETQAYDRAIFNAAILGEEKKQGYLEMLLDKALHKRDIGVTIDDKIVLLTTCSSEDTNARDVVIARITDQVFSDPFWTDEPDGGPLVFVDSQTGRFCLTCLLPLILSAIVGAMVYRSLKKSKKRDDGL
jgi:sortase B